MNKKFQSIIASIFFTVAVTFNSTAQIAIANLDQIAELKNGITYVVMKDPDFPGAKEYIDMFKRSWTISRIQFIKYSDVHNHYGKGNYFLSIGGYKFEDQYTTMFGGFFTGPDGTTNEYPNAGFDVTNIYLELWTCTDKYVENRSNKEVRMNNTIQLARVELFTDLLAFNRPKYLYEEEYNSTVRIRNWGVGILENYVQSIMAYFNHNQARKLYSPITNSAELAKLKTETLYVPNYILIEYDKKTNNETKTHVESELFAKYTLKHKLLTNEELNAKILNKKEPVYYFIYVRSSRDKFVSVINSLTGEIVYSRYTPMSYNVQADDLNDLQLEIQK